MAQPRLKYYYGPSSTSRITGQYIITVFSSRKPPGQQTHGMFVLHAVGPFRTKAAAIAHAKQSHLYATFGYRIYDGTRIYN